MSQPLQPFPINQLGSMADKQTIGCVEGILHAAWKPKTGTTGTGQPYSIQNATLRTDTGEVKLWLKDREELSLQWKGKRIRIESLQSDKGLSGLYVFDDEYQGKTERKLKVTPSATISIIQGDGGGQQQPQQQQPTNQQKSRQQQAAESWGDESQYGNHSEQQQPQHQEQPREQQHQPTDAEKREARKREKADSFAEAKRQVMQVTNLHLLCAQAVAQYEAKAYKETTGIPMSESQQQGATASIFIESCKLGLVRNMPTTAIIPSKQD